MQKEKRQAKRIFSTITFKDCRIEDFDLTAYTKWSEKVVSRQCLVLETGAYGKNDHYHLYAELKRPSRTDIITRKLKSFYDTSAGYVNRYTVKTLRENDPIYRIGYYFQKEINAIVVLNKGIDLQKFKKLYTERRSLAQLLIKEKNHQHYRNNELPSVYIAYCHAKDLPYAEYQKNFSNMIRDGIIQLNQMRILKDVKVMVDVLKGELIPEYYLYE